MYQRNLKHQSLIKKGAITLGEINEMVSARHIMTAGSPSGTTIN